MNAQFELLLAGFKNIYVSFTVFVLILFQAIKSLRLCILLILEMRMINPTLNLAHALGKNTAQTYDQIN